MNKTPGQQLKAAREELGKSQSDMAKETRISVQQLQGLEEDCYDKIPAPMYVRGFMKLYAQKLGLNHEPLVQMYERMQNGESLAVEDMVAAPRPMQEEVMVEEEEFHPEISREVHRKPARTAPRFDWQILKDKVPKLPENISLDWLQDPRIRIAGGVGLILVVLILGLRGCRSEGEPVEGPVESSESTPVVDDPLLNPPEPVYFELPSSYQ